MNALLNALRRPLLAQLLASRAVCAWIAVAAAAHIALSAAGIGGWPCPIKAATGIPCPGCGLGSASALLLRGHWTSALRVHAFAPVLIAALLAIAVSAFLRKGARESLVAATEKIERTVPVSVIVLGALLAYWLWRL